MIISGLKTRKKLVLAFLISLVIQIILFLGFNYFNLISRISQNSLFYEFFINSFEPYQDYQIWYHSFVENFIHEDWVPYSAFFPDIGDYTDYFSYLWDLLVGISQYYYIYPPFFLYIISLPGLIDINLIFIPLVISTNLLPVLIYKLLSTHFNEKIAEWGFFTTVFCPILIFYNGGLLLNTSLVTLFFIITLYFVSLNRFKSACIFLAISFLFKQTVIFFILPTLAYMVIQSSKNREGKFIKNYFKDLLVFSSLILGIIFLGSLPWIIINPSGYIKCILVTGGFSFLPYFQIPNFNSPMHWYSFLAGLNLPYWILYFIGFLTFTFIGIILIELVVIVLLHHWHYQESLNWLKFLDIITYTAFLSHLFFPRGVYKYYFTFHIPLIIIWLSFHFKDLLGTQKSIRIKWFVYFISITSIFLLIPRNFYLLFVWVIIILMIKKNLNMNKTYQNKIGILE
ncbi:MAG: glycosyltransferase family 39 protein [Candidatus Hermodarchaeota archaeon]